MSCRVGTIHELEGKGWEVLVDIPTRSVVLAEFFDGAFIRRPQSSENERDEQTLVLE